MSAAAAVNVCLGDVYAWLAMASGSERMRKRRSVHAVACGQWSGRPGRGSGVRAACDGLRRRGGTRRRRGTAGGGSVIGGLGRDELAAPNRAAAAAAAGERLFGRRSRLLAMASGSERMRRRRSGGASSVRPREWRSWMLAMASGSERKRKRSSHCARCSGVAVGASHGAVARRGTPRPGRLLRRGGNWRRHHAWQRRSRRSSPS